MKKLTTKLLLLSALALTAIFQTGCSDDDEEVYYPIAQQFDGSYQSIQDFVTPELLATMQAMGLEINSGSNPPDLEGDFLVDPNVLVGTNRPSDNIGSIFTDNYLHFENQNNLSHTVDFSYEQPGAETGIGTGTYISGNGNHFSAFFKQTATIDGLDAEAIIVVSGQMTAEGIVNYQSAGFMKNNNGHVPTFIENGQGRLFEDGDNLAIRL